MWDGDAYSTTAKTPIDLQAVAPAGFALPAGIKAVSVCIACRDSGSLATSNIFILLGPNNTAGTASVIARLTEIINDQYAKASGIVKCDANCDVWYQIVASGAGTMDMIFQIWGYWI